MSSAQKLKSYLIDESYLFDKRNNGNVIMISGLWGSGKTHFWKNRIEPELSRLTKNEKAYVYISLYGKENTDSIKDEILLKAYESIKKENTVLERSISVFNNGSKYVPSVSIFGVRLDFNSMDGFFSSKKATKAKELLMDGGIICFDDFERKSEKIDLNDLFGLITQLSQEMKCKIVVILNSEVFDEKDAVLFRNIKEKTVNKFLYFTPTIDELFKSVFADKKYIPLIPQKNDILQWLKTTNELNARLYIQVLDNCLEWVTKKYSIDVLKPLILISIFFSKYHFTLEYRKLDNDTNIYTVVDYFLHKGFYETANFLTKTAKTLFAKEKPLDIDEAMQILMSHVNDKDQKKQKSEDYLRMQNEEITKHKDLIIEFINYVYFLKVDTGLNEEKYMQINDFVKNGILEENKADTRDEIKT